MAESLDYLAKAGMLTQILWLSAFGMLGALLGLTLCWLVDLTLAGIAWWCRSDDEEAIVRDMEELSLAQKHGKRAKRKGKGLK